MLWRTTLFSRDAPDTGYVSGYPVLSGRGRIIPDSRIFSFIRPDSLMLTPLLISIREKPESGHLGFFRPLASPTSIFVYGTINHINFATLSIKNFYWQCCKIDVITETTSIRIYKFTKTYIWVLHLSR